MRRAVLLLLVLVSTAHADPDRLVEATMERRVFRQTFIGSLRYPARRTTWVLYLGADLARLEVFCQAGSRSESRGIRLSGKEREEASWMPPASVRYVGQRRADKIELTLAGPAPDKDSSCRGTPTSLELSCRSAKVTVRPQGVTLVPGAGPDSGSRRRPTWRPAAQASVTALRCQRSTGAFADDGFEEPWPLVFAGRAIEWVHENSDMVVQAGAYRWL